MSENMSRHPLSIIPSTSLLLFSSLTFQGSALAHGMDTLDSDTLCQIATQMNDDGAWNITKGRNYASDTLTFEIQTGSTSKKLGTWVYDFDRDRGLLRISHETWNGASSNKELANALETAAISRILKTHPMTSVIRVEDFEGSSLSDFLFRLDLALQNHSPTEPLSTAQNKKLIEIVDAEKRAKANSANELASLVKFSMHWSEVIQDLQKNSPNLWFEIALEALNPRSLHKARFADTGFTVTANSIQVDFHEEDASLIDNELVRIELPFLSYTVEKTLKR